MGSPTANKIDRPRRPFSLLFFVRRWFRQRKAHVVVKNDGLMLCWDNLHYYLVTWELVEQFAEWLSRQPDDQPIIMHGITDDDKKKQASTCAPAESVRKLKLEFAIMTVAYERSFRQRVPEQKKKTETTKVLN